MADDSTPGVRGPRGPQQGPQRGSGGRGGNYGGRTGNAGSSTRTRFERVSLPMLARLHAAPRWLVVVTPAVLLFLGLILQGPVLSWIGALLLLVTAALIGWLTALSWPAVGAGSRLLRVVIVLALLGLAVLKALHRL